MPTGPTLSVVGHSAVAATFTFEEQSAPSVGCLRLASSILGTQLWDASILGSEEEVKREAGQQGKEAASFCTPCFAVPRSPPLRPRCCWEGKHLAAEHPNGLTSHNRLRGTSFPAKQPLTAAEQPVAVAVESINFGLSHSLAC